MKNYRNISQSFWTDSKVDDDFTPEEKYFMLYLLTNPHTSVCGCYEISMKQMERETGYNADTVSRLISRMQDVHKVIRYDQETKEVLILNWHKYNWTKSEKLLRAVVSAAAHIKSEQFKSYVMHTVSIRYPYSNDTSDKGKDKDNDNINDNINDNDNGEEKESAGEPRPDAPAPSSSGYQQIPDHPNIKLTEKEHNELRNLDFSKTGKRLETYFAIMDERIASGKKYKDHFLVLRKWAMQDGAAVNKNSNSSFDPSDFDKLVNRFGGASP